jgi:hypothetical protein
MIAVVSIDTASGTLRRYVKFESRRPEETGAVTIRPDAWRNVLARRANLDMKEVENFRVYGNPAGDPA